MVLILVVAGMAMVLLCHPMSGVMLLIVVTVLYFCALFLKMSVLWFGLVLTLVMLSGMLVLFTYMASLNPNERFEVMSFYVGSVFMSMLVMGGMGYKVLLEEDYSVMTLSLWENVDIFMMLFMLVVLLLVMLVVVSVVGKGGGALRVECEKEVG